eukprot:scpid102416/ scgid29335/ 
MFCPVPATMVLVDPVFRGQGKRSCYCSGQGELTATVCVRPMDCHPCYPRLRLGASCTELPFAGLLNPYGILSSFSDEFEYSKHGDFNDYCAGSTYLQAK